VKSKCEDEDAQIIICLGEGVESVGERICIAVGLEIRRKNTLLVDSLPSVIDIRQLTITFEAAANYDEYT
jgi:hypothetical protein